MNACEKGGGMGMMDGRRFLITGQKTWHKVLKDRKKKQKNTNTLKTVKKNQSSTNR